MGHQTDTITAIATPIGEGGIAVVRVSGSQAIAATARVFRGNADLTAAGSHTAHHGAIQRGSLPIDDVVVILYRGPNSYTGEDVVEINCHGGAYITRQILDIMLQAGCRHAEPGEFTKRAFLRGKMDLSQAEAVADLIHARSERSREASFRQLTGQLSARINALRDDLVLLTGKLELELDFAEEGYQFEEAQVLRKRLEKTITQIGELVSSYREGRLYRDGVKMVLAGKPNVGKSSLLNALLMEERAIVTDVPGTTRDTIEESLVIDGMTFRAVDTAGLRETVDRVEREGVRRSEDQIRLSDLLVVVVDGSVEPEAQEITLIERLLGDLKKSGTPAILVKNKVDLIVDRKKNVSPGRFAGFSHVMPVSALTREGIGKLKMALVESSMGPARLNVESEVTVTNARHVDALRRSQQSLQLCLESLDAKQSREFLAVDLRCALDSLGEITGAITTDDILNEVFSRFCIGK